MAAPALAALAPMLMKIAPYLIGAMGAQGGGGGAGGGGGRGVPMAADPTLLLQHNFPGMKGQRYFGSGGPNNQFMFMEAAGQRPSKTQKGLINLLSALNNIRGAQTLMGGGGLGKLGGRGAGAQYGGLIGGGGNETVGDFGSQLPRFGGGLIGMGPYGILS